MTRRWLLAVSLLVALALVGVGVGGVAAQTSLGNASDHVEHRWPLDDVSSGTVTDTVGNADGTVNGVSSVSGTYQGGSAGDGDGTDDYISVDVTNFLENAGTDFAVGFTINYATLPDSSNSHSLMGMAEDVTGGNKYDWWVITASKTTDGAIGFDTNGRNDNRLEIETGSTVETNSKVRVLFNKKTNDASNFEMYFNNSAQPISVLSNELGYSDPEFNGDLYLYGFHDIGIGDGSRFQDVIMDDVIFYNDSLSSAEVSDDYTAQPWVTTGPDFNVSITGTNAPVVEGNTLNIDYNVTNTGNVQGTQTITLDVAGQQRDSVSETIAAGDFATGTLSWSPSAGDAGSYTATVASENDTATELVTVQGNVPYFDVNITDSQSPLEGNALLINAGIKNTGTVIGTQTITADVPGIGSDTASVSLAPGEETIEGFSIATSAGDAGSYTAEISSDNDTATGPVSVTADAPFFDVSITKTNGPVRAGETLRVNYRVENTGTKGGMQQITLNASGQQRDSELISLIPGTDAIGQLQWSIPADVAPAATATVASDNDSETRLIADLGGNLTELQRIPLTGDLTAAAVSQDGLAAVAAGSTVSLLNVSSGVVTDRLTAPAATVQNLAWRPNASQLAVTSNDATVYVYDISGASGAEPSATIARTLGEAAGPTTGIAWSPDGSQLAVGSAAGQLRVYDVASGYSVAANLSEAGPVRGVAWRPANQQLAVGVGASVVVRESVGSFGVEQTLSVGSDVEALAYAPSDDALAAGTQAGRAVVWDTSGYTILSNASVASRARAVAWGPASRVIAVGDSAGPVTVIEPIGGTVQSQRGSQARAAAWHPDGERLLYGGAGRLTVATRTPAVTGTVSDFDGDPLGGVRVSGANRQTITNASGEYVLPVRNGSATITATTGVDSKSIDVSVDETGLTVPISLDAGPRNDSTSVLGSFQNEQPINDIAWGPAGNRVAVAEGPNSPWEVAIYNIRSGSVVQVLSQAGSSVTDVAWSPDGDRLVYTQIGDPGINNDDRHRAYVHETDTWSVVQTLDGGDQFDSTRGLAWSADSQRLAWLIGVETERKAVNSDPNELRVYDRGPWSTVMTETVAAESDGVAWSPDDSALAVGSPGERTVVLNATTGAFARSYPGGAASPAYSPDGEQLALGGGAPIFDTGELSRTDHPRGSGPLDWYPGGERLAVADGTVAVRDRSGAFEHDRLSQSPVDGVVTSRGGGFTAYTVGNDLYIESERPVVKGQVTDPDGNPIGGASVVVDNRAQPDDAVVTVTDQNGRYAQVVDSAGQYDVLAQLRQSSFGTQGVENVTVPVTGKTVNIQLNPSATGIRGFIKNASGDPVQAARVTARAQSSQVNATRFTFPDGFYSVPLSGGDYNLSATRFDHTESSATVSVPTSGLVNLTIEQPGGVVVAGQVTDPQGSPIEDAVINAAFNQTLSESTGRYALRLAQPGRVAITAANGVDSKRKIVDVPPDGLDGVDFVLERPADPAQPAGNLVIRDEQTGAILNDRLVQVRFFGEENATVRNTTTGYISLASLSLTEPVVAAGETVGFASRRILIDDTGADHTVFLLDEANTTTTVVTEFRVDDRTGLYSDNDTRIQLRRVMPLPGESGNIPFRVLASDFVGPDDALELALEQDSRIRVRLRNGENVRELGAYVAVRDKVVKLTVGTLTFRLGNRQNTTAYGARRFNISGQSHIRAIYNDSSGETDTLNITIHETNNRSRTLYQTTFQGPVGNGSVLVPVPNSTRRNVTSWTVLINQTKDGESTTYRTVVASSNKYPVETNSAWMPIFSALFLTFVGGFFSVRVADLGVIIVPIVALLLWTMGWLPLPLPWILAALAIGVGSEFASRKGFADR